MRQPTRRIVRIATVAGLLAAASVGIANAGIPDSGQVYTACLLNQVGTVRLIDPSLGPGNWMGHCSKLETQINWNQHGQSGPPGSGVTATFAFGSPNMYLGPPDQLTQVTSKHLDAGSYAVVATVDLYEAGNFGGDRILDLACELHNGNAFIGGATDRRVLPDLDTITALLAVNGGAQVPAGGGDVSLWCRSQLGIGFVKSAQVMILRIGGFG